MVVVGGRKMLVWHAQAIIAAFFFAPLVFVIVVFPDMMWITLASIFAFFGIVVTYAGLMDNGIINRMDINTLVAKLIKTMSNQCVACGKPILPGENHSDYHFVQNHWTSHIGTLSVHHKPECAGAGLGFLEKHSQDADKRNMIAVHRIGNRTYSLAFLMKDGKFWFSISTPYNKPYDATIDFLRTYRRSPDVVLAVRHGSDKSSRIPILLSAKSPHIDQMAFAGKTRQKAMKKAEVTADREMSVLGCNQTQEIKILSQYARNTFVGLKASRAITM